ncbi:MAG: trypsin-like serine protease [Renibacterium sp.]|nr:trypsin-like serine protease [Renibacterium sp.]
MHTPFKLFSAALLATGLLLSSGLASASAAPAGSGGATPKIIGGSQADDQGIVQLVFTDDAGSHACTGTALSDTWVLTAKHCVETAASMNIYYSNDTKNRGKAVAADSFYQSPKGDVGLVKLAVAHPLSEYHGFSSSYLATVGDQGTIYGYGRREGYVKADHLYQAEVKVSGSGKDQRGGTSIKLKAVTGISWSGDSGGPLFIDGTIVGTSSGGPSDRDINSEVWYAQLSGHSSWIKQTTGL